MKAYLLLNLVQVLIDESYTVPLKFELLTNQVGCNIFNVSTSFFVNLSQCVTLFRKENNQCN